MIRSATCLLSLLLACVAVAPVPARAAESYDGCTGLITTLPKTIGTPGTWCLTADLSSAASSGSPILVSASNVTIDCNGHKLDGSAAGLGTTAIGISASTRYNVTVRNCTLLGFQQAVRLSGAGGGHLVEDNRVDGNTFIGINVQGAGSSVRNNQVTNTGNSSTLAPAYGIYAVTGVDVIDNTVSGVTARPGGAGVAAGLYVQSGAGASVLGNRVRDVVGDGAQRSFGVYVNATDRLIVRQNDLVGAGAGSTGIRCAATANRVRGNTISGFTTGLQACGDGGSNDIAN
jgi:hypothetical protein